MGRSKLHTKYVDDMFQPVPSVTTVLGILAKPALVHAAWKLGCEGKDYKEEWKIKAGIGTLVHHMILSHLKDEQPDTSKYIQEDIDRAETCFLKYLDWEKSHPFEVIKAEEPMVSNTLKYGGTPDLVCMMNDMPTLVDFKSGKAIYHKEMGAQLAAYDHMLVEHGIICKKWMIVRIGRDEKEGFEVKQFDMIDDYWEHFHNALATYYSDKKLDGR